MAERDKFVAVGLFTASEFARWGSKLRHVYPVEGNAEFDALLRAIDKADEDQARSGLIHYGPKN